MALKLGIKAKDVVTEMEGIIVGRTSWLTGCDTYGLQPQGLNKDGQPYEAKWFDENRLLPLSTEPAVLVPAVQAETSVG